MAREFVTPDRILATGKNPYQSPPVDPGVDPYSLFSQQTLEFLALDGDQQAIAELSRRQAGGGTAPSIVDIGGGLVGVKMPDGTWQIREANAPGGGGSTRTQFPSEAALDAAQAELARAQIGNMAAQRENERRQAGLSAYTSLADRAMASAAEARKQQAEFAGIDPFRLIAAQHGRAPGTGMTPFDLFKGQLATTANQQIPQVNASSSADQIEAAVNTLIGAQQSQANQQPIPFAPAGMAMGGVMRPVAMGGLPPPAAPPPPVQFGGAGYGVMVGDGTINGDEEVMHMKPDGTVEVIPLIGGAAGGAVLPDPNLTVLPELFSNLRSDITRGAANEMAALGYLTEPSGSPARFGEGWGGRLAPLTVEQGYLEAGMDPAQAKRISGMIGLLPNPRNLASRLKSVPLNDMGLVLSAYKMAGMPAATFNELLKSALLTGPERKPVSLS